MAKLSHIVKADGVTHHGWMFWCPGCEIPHSFDDRWTFNGDQENPTFNPSLRVIGGPKGECHLFLRDGSIQFLGDCDHALAGVTVAVPEWEDRSQ